MLALLHSEASYKSWVRTYQCCCRYVKNRPMLHPSEPPLFFVSRVGIVKAVKALIHRFGYTCCHVHSSKPAGEDGRKLLEYLSMLALEWTAVSKMLLSKTVLSLPLRRTAMTKS